MKETVQSDAKQAQNAVAESARSPRPQQTFAPGGRLAQLATMMKDSPQLHALAQQKNEVQDSSRVHNLMEQAAEINQGAPAQLRVVPVNDNEADVMGAKALASRDADVNQARASGGFSNTQQERADRSVFQEGNQPGYAMQLKSSIVQRIGFLAGQAQLMVEWLEELGIDEIPIFQGIVQRFRDNQRLEDNDAEAITLLFLTKEKPYREFAEAGHAIRFIFWDVDGYSIPRNVTTVGEFTNAFKTFYHLYKRAVNAHRPYPIMDVYYGFAGLDAALGDVQTGAVTFGSDETGSGPDVHIAIIKNFAQNHELDFASAESAISHLIKHGTLFNWGVKLTGHEPADQLQDVYNSYISRANAVVAFGNAIQLGDTLGKEIFSFKLGDETAIVSFDAATASAELTTYFPTEPLAQVNDEPVLAHGFI